MGIPAAAVSLGSMLAGAAGTGLQAYGTSSADSYEAKMEEQAAQYGTLKATQTNAQLTRNINQTLGNIDAVRAAARTDPTSPTGAAVRNTVESADVANKNIQVDSIMEQARMDEANASYLRQASSMALLSGAVGAVGDVFKGISGIPNLGGGVPGSPLTVPMGPTGFAVGPV